MHNIPKRILITGCRGFVASNLIKFLDTKKYKINCVSRNISDTKFIPYGDYDKIKEAVKNSDIIIHLAAITNPFDSNIWKVNVDYTRFLVIEAKKYNKRFIYVSSQNVLFGKDNYSKTKKEAESIVKTLKNFVILRPTIIYGKDDDRYIGKLIRIIKNYPLVPIIGSGKNKLQPIYVGDLIDIIKIFIKNDINGIFLVAGPSVITYNELVELIIKKLKLRRVKIHIPVGVIKLFLYLSQMLLKNPPITTIQLDNLKVNQDYDIQNTKKLFHIKLINIEEGLDIIMENE